VLEADLFVVAAAMGHRSVRLGFLLAILAGVVAIAVLRPIGSPGGGLKGSEPLGPSAQQLQHLSMWLVGVPVPAGLHRDVTLTSCVEARLLCLTGSATPQGIAARVGQALAAHGASMGAPDCSLPASPQSSLPSCVAVGNWRGIAIAVLSGRRLGYTQPDSWTDVDPRWGATNPPPAEPLPRLGALGAVAGLARNWHLSLRCTIYSQGGCTYYRGNAALNGSACDRASEFISALVRSHLNINMEMRRPLPAGQKCIVVGSTNLKPGGLDSLSVYGFFIDQRASRVQAKFIFDAT
jgi:hypothetical protein